MSRVITLIMASEVDILARTVYGEARGESYKSQKAVAHAMINRWLSLTGQFAKDDTLATACLRHKQFSAWTIGDANFEKMFRADFVDPAYRSCFRASLEALDEEDFTHGSLHYHTKDSHPSWAEGSPTLAVGNHLFYNYIK